MEVGIESDRHREVEAVYRDQAPKLWRALLLSTGSTEVASDATAEAFAQLIARRVGVRDPAAWVWRSAFKIAMGEMKRRGTLEPLPPDLPAATREPLVDLVRALGSLTAHQRSAVVLADYAGWSHSEVAKALGSTPAAVAVHVHRARRRLRTLLEEADD